MFDVIVIGAGPAGIQAVSRAAEPGADTALATRGATPLSFPTYVGIVGWAAYEIMRQLGLAIGEQPWEPHRIRV